MRRFAKVIGALVGVIILAVTSLIVTARVSWAQHAARVYEGVDGPAVVVRYDAASIARGEHLGRAIAGCTDCHGADLGGAVFIDDPGLGRFAGANLTKGRGGRGGRLGERDWVRAITRGVGDSRRSLLVMPSRDYQTYSREDIAALVAWGRTRPPVDRESDTLEVNTLAYVLTLLGKLPAHSAEDVDPGAEPRANPTPARTAEYGDYLAQSCTGCHRSDLAGGPMAAAPPDCPAPPNLTELTSERDFLRAMREGRSKDGHQLHAFMPWRSLRHMTDDELGAIWLRLQREGRKATHEE